MKLRLAKGVIGVLLLLCTLCGIWVVVSNIRYHYFPIQYDILARGTLPYDDPAINEAHLWVISSGTSEYPPLPSEVLTVIDQVDLQENIVLVIENQVYKPYTPTSPDVRRIIDISNDRIHIESLLYASPTAPPSTIPATYDYVVLSFPKKSSWADEVDFYLWNDEQEADYVRARIR